MEVPRALLLIPLLVLAGCATPGPIPAPSPADFPMQAADQHFQLHWRLVREGDRVRVEGLMETRAPTVDEVTLVLYGLDREGRIVSRGLAIVRWGFRREPQTFTVTLRPAGTEERFDL